MIIDTSALITGEDDAANLERVLDQAPIRRISAANYVEAGIVHGWAGRPGAVSSS
jgi:uncharacterized protein with PIN domain